MFHERLREMRLKRCISQVSMAKQLGVARQTYLDMESGHTEPKLSKLIKLSELLGVSLEWLCTGQNESVKHFKSELAKIVESIKEIK